MNNGLKILLKRPFEVRAYSRLGWASFCLALLAALVVIGEVIAVVMSRNSVTGLGNLQVLDAWLTGTTVLLAFAGFVVGIPAVAQREKKRLFGWVGLVANGLFLAGMIVLFLLNVISFWKLALG